MKPQQLVFLAILVFAAFTRFYNLEKPPAYYFDEVYHAVTAKAYALNNPAGYEWWHEAPEPNTAYEWLHPPIAKLFMAVGWRFLGQSAWAWRVPGAIVGILVIATVYWLTLVLSRDRKLAVLAAGLASLDGLLLSMSRIGMNDIYVTWFMLLAIGSYWKSRQAPRWPNWWVAAASICSGLAMSTKWSGLFVIGMIATWELLLLIKEKAAWIRRLPLLIIAFGIVPLAIYVASYTQFWLQGHTWAQFEELHHQIWWYQTNLKATHSYQSQAWEWPLSIRPVWFFVEYLPDNRVANIYNLGNPLLFWFGLIAIIWLCLKPSRLAQIITVAYAWSWMPWLLSPRIMFSYHYTPAVPWLTIAAAILIHLLYKTHYTKLAIITVVSIAITFIWLSPLWLGIPLDPNHLKLLFLLPSWK